jgi:hypothetical protein
MLYYVRRIIYADVRKKRGPDLIIEPAEVGQRESRSGWASVLRETRLSQSMGLTMHMITFHTALLGILTADGTTVT